MSAEYVSGISTKVYKCSLPIELEMCDERLVLSEEESYKMQTYWEQALQKNNTLFNGDVLTIKEIQNIDGKILINLALTDYAHLTYVMNHGKEEITGCKSMAAGGLLITKDDYMLVGKMGKKTSFPGIIQCIGGGISKEDITGEEAPVNTVIRECHEEIGIQVKRNFINISEKYVYVRDKMSTLGFVYIVCLDLSKNEAMNIFHNFKENDHEIEELICLKNDEKTIIDFCQQNTTVDYLKPVLYDYANICAIKPV